MSDGQQQKSPQGITWDDEQQSTPQGITWDSDEAPSRPSEAEFAKEHTPQGLKLPDVQPNWTALALEHSPSGADPHNPGNANWQAIPESERSNVASKLLPVAMATAVPLSGETLTGTGLRTLGRGVIGSTLGAEAGRYGGRGIGYAVGGPSGAQMGERIGAIGGGLVGSLAGGMRYDPLEKRLPEFFQHPDYRDELLGRQISNARDEMYEDLARSRMRRGIEQERLDRPPKGTGPGGIPSVSGEGVEGRLPREQDRIVKLPQEFASEDVRQAQAERQARIRGMQYAAGMRPGYSKIPRVPTRIETIEYPGPREVLTQEQIQNYLGPKAGKLRVAAD